MYRHLFFNQRMIGRALNNRQINQLHSSGLFITPKIIHRLSNKMEYSTSLNLPLNQLHTSGLHLREYVDIYEFPDINEQYKADKGAQITIGDLHANTMKLIFLLIKHQIATNITKEEYGDLVNIYKVCSKDQTKENLALFNRILNKMIINNQVTIRLIGDEVADRLHNDYYTLCAFKKLKKHGVPIEILLSNHGVEFIEAYETQTHFFPPRLSEEHANSMINMRLFIKNKLISEEEINEWIASAYKPILKAVSCTLSENNGITIYSHAGIDFDIIKRISMALDISYNDQSALEMAKTIDRINDAFQKHVMNNSVHTLYDKKSMAYAYEGYVNLKNSPFEALMWNRSYDELNRPSFYSGYFVNFVHGHHLDRCMGKNIFNLDNNLGKLPWLNEGDYTIMLSYEKTLTQYKHRSRLNQSGISLHT